MSNSSKESFVDASTDDVRLDESTKEAEREAPLSTPVKDDTKRDIQPTTGEQLQKQRTVTIFDVATEIEAMLQDITNQIETQDLALSDKVDSINMKLDKLESRIKK